MLLGLKKSIICVIQSHASWVSTLSPAPPQYVHIHNTKGTFVASFIANTVINPLDVVKSRLQNMRRPAAGEAPMYKSMVDCFAKTIKLDGTVLFPP
jgi:hypothetical protein